MAFSSGEGKKLFEDWFRAFYEPSGVVVQPMIKSVLDVGPGAGIYGKLIREIAGSNVFISGVEVYEPYLERFGLNEIYDEVFVGSIQDFLREDGRDFDLVIFGDSLEHFSLEEALEIFSIIKSRAKFVFVSIPLIYPGKDWHEGYDQPSTDWEENIHEKHLLGLTVQEFEDKFGPFVGKVHYCVVSVYIVEGALSN